MQVTIIHPAINLNERGLHFALPGFLGEDHIIKPSPTVEQPTPTTRSSGMHVSTLIKSIAVKTGILKGVSTNNGRFKSGSIIDESDFPLCMFLGMAFEDKLATQYPDMLYHIGELSLDGIAGSPDGITLFPGTKDYENLGDGCVEEFKLTWKSARHPLEHPNNWMWLTQVKAYCKMLPCLCARIHVVYVNGDYSYERPGMPCMYRVYAIRFEQYELDQTWRMLLTERDCLLAAGVSE